MTLTTMPSIELIPDGAASDSNDGDDSNFDTRFDDVAVRTGGGTEDTLIGGLGNATL